MTRGPRAPLRDAGGFRAPRTPVRGRLPILGPIVVAASAVLCASCAQALYPVDELPTIQGSGHSEADARRLAGEAEASYRARTVPAVERAVELWREAAAADLESVEALLGVVQAQVWLGSHLESDAERESRAVDAVKNGQLCVERDPDSVPCRYWLAIAVGLQARERRSTGLDAVKRMERLLLDVVERDPEIDRAGPHRVLALLYLRAPGWPSGPGDPDLGLEHAEEAVRLDPDHPPNRLCLAEALAAVGDPSESRRQYALAAESALAALARGEPDAAEWLAEAERESGGDAGD
jgi:hypothetical protein